MAAATQIRAGSAFVELTVNDAKLVAGLKRARARLKAFGQSLSTLGSNLLRLGTITATPFALAAREFAGFEQAMARVRALTGASAADFAALKQQARELGKSTVFTASQAAEAMSFFALAGFDVQQILAAVAPTLSLAAAGQIEIAQAADIAAKIMAGMGIEAGELGRVVDVMAKAMTTANTDMLMLGDAFKFVGPIAKNAGISLEEITAAIQLLSNAGIQGEMAGTTLRGMLLTLTSPSKEAANQLKRLGVEISDAEGNVRPLVDILADLERGLANAGSGRRLQILGQIFPNRQAAGAAVLIGQSQILRQATEALQNAGGTGAKIASIQLDTLSGSVKILLSALQDVAIELGKALAPELRQWAAALTQALNVLSRLIKENKQFFVAIAKGALIVIGIGGALVALGAAIQLVAFALGGLATAFSLGIAAFGLVKGAVLGLFTPLGAFLKLLDSVVTGYFVLTDQGQATLRALGASWNRLRDIASLAWQGIVDSVMAGDLALAGKIAMAALKAAWVETLNFLQIAWINFKDFLASTWNNLVSGLAIVMNDFVTGLQVIWLEVTTFLSKAWASFVGAAQKVWAKFIGFFRESWATAQGTVAAILGDDAGVEAAAQQIVRIRNDVARQVQEIDQNVAKRRREIEQDRLRRGQKIVADQKAVEMALGQELAREGIAREKRRRRELAALAKEVDAAQKELDQLAQQAAQKRGQLPPVDKAVQQAAGKIPGLAAVATGGGGPLTGQAIGTFNPEALRALGAADTIQQKQLLLLEKLVALDKQMIEELRNAGIKVE
ncbi:MAG: hypothetical protein KatS3mg082_2735 [Nitrospiraceae bacterium]|nr:MAG: hypothetical protein KatS3mg082_2735 [Nitrospiraceae bacterium]GIW81338.1 MAG: hypothetical protein KatS3mg105_3145 [Gemmatales bacterium]